MCAREDVDYQGQEIKSRLAEMESKLECFDKKINVVRECCEKNLSIMETLLKKNKRRGKETIIILGFYDTNSETQQCTAFDSFVITLLVLFTTFDLE